MINYFKIIATSLLIHLLHVNALAQVPATWTVNPNSYQYQMTVTGIANENCINLADTNNFVAAFVGGQCRGLVKTNVVYNGTKIAMLLIKSNVTSGEYVKFKIYKASTNTILSVLDSITFLQGSTIGQLTNPIQLNTNLPPSSLSLSNASIVETASVGTLVGSLSAADNDPSATFTYSLTSTQTENSQFAISTNQLNTNSTFNFESDNVKLLDIAVTDNFGCTLVKTFTISILNDNDAPSALSLIATNISDGQTANSFIGKLYTFDPDAADTHTYTLVSGAGDLDNNQFYVRNDSVFNTNQIFYSVQNNFSVRLRTTDAGGLYYENSFSLIVSQLNSSPTDIVLSNNSINENSETGTEIGVFSVIDANTSDTHTITLTAGLGSIDNSLVSINSNVLKSAAIYNFDTKTFLEIRAIAIDNYGGTFAKTFTISVNDINGENLPFKSSNFISPNGDGKNDFWKVENVSVFNEYQLQIFDQFGQIIYEKQNNYNNEFDGKLNGKALPTGNYYYLFKSSSKEYKGNISIVN